MTTVDQTPPVVTAAQYAALVEDYVRAAGAGDDQYLDRDTHLFEEGYLDSLATLGLIDALEQAGGRPVPAEVLLDPRFASIDGIAGLLASGPHA